MAVLSILKRVNDNYEAGDEKGRSPLLATLSIPAQM
jgi:hypothetical protein